MPPVSWLPVNSRSRAPGMMVAVIVLVLVDVALSAMIWRVQAYPLRWQEYIIWRSSHVALAS